MVMKSHRRGNRSHRGRDEGKAYNHHPTTTVIQSRVPIFAPVSRHAANKPANVDSDTTFSTSWGTCTVRQNRLTQIHRDLIEGIFTYHSQICRHETGEVTFLINPYQVLQMMRQERPDIDWLRDKLEEMRNTCISVTEKKGACVLTVEAGIVARHGYISKRSYGSGENQFDKGDYGVEFSAEFLRAFAGNMWLNYPKLVGKILAVKSPLVRAVIRFFLTHNDFSYKPEHVLTTLGVLPDKVSKRAWNQKLQELREAAPILAQFGIQTTDTCLTYEKHESVWFGQSKQQARLAGKLYPSG